MTDHTPLPWEVFNPDWAEWPSIMSQDTVIVDVGCSDWEDAGVRGASPEEAPANAAFIVRACNSHYDLIEALRIALAELTAFAGCVYHDDVREEIEANIAKGRAALARAKGE